jgi:chitin deacetylase
MSKQIYSKLKSKLFFLVALTIIAALVFLFFSYSPSSNFYGRVFSHAQTSKKVIALTFDDGPNGDATLKVLDVLKKENIKATFFLVGDNVLYYPQVAKQIVADGNEVENHSMHHDRAMPFEPIHDITRNLLQANKIIASATGQSPLFFRPPFGVRTPWTLRAAKKAGLIVITWNDLAKDFANLSADAISSNVIKAAKPGGIITLHDGQRTTHDANRDQTIKALPKIIDTLKSQGYIFVTVANLASGNY